ncbi:MAG: DUF1622 domain-containing protein [Actinomycetota bacterium]|nr:DUF1622 domain-containing protein [Actinomycetota bacterium]MDH5314239.1 DUF1622 domain-containing protein [Actinomycetota bacterium]
MALSYEDFMSDVVTAFELVGVAILIVGSLLAFARYVRELLGGEVRLKAFSDLRASLGRAILLGLEVLVVADIVRTIVVEPTLESAATLGVIVVVRILLSFAIDVEVDGVAPWRKARSDAGANG